VSDRPDVVIYTAPGCGWCGRARALLDRHGVTYEEVRGSMDRAGRVALEAATGARTFPQVLVDGHPIGGYRELRSIARTGGLGDALTSGPLPLRAYVTPCNLVYGAIAVATLAAVAVRLLG
jgi:glutaredoxin 3